MEKLGHEQANTDVSAPPRYRILEEVTKCPLPEKASGQTGRELRLQWPERTGCPRWGGKDRVGQIQD